MTPTPEQTMLILHNVALPAPGVIDEGNAGVALLAILDYFPDYIRYGGIYTWGGYVSWALKALAKRTNTRGEDIMGSAMLMAGGTEAFFSLYISMPSIKPQGGQP
uniref:Uncharacterized protein n=1 Tax=viral metagenome TaxID=1070528 RepID=A0A6M3LL48_9ZZZZ